MERLLKLYRERFGSEPASVELLPLSGSARKYYRMAAGPAPGRPASSGAVSGPSAGCSSGTNTDSAAVIGCVGTSLKENRAFLTIDAAMRYAGVAAPEVFGVSPDGMAYLQEDLGDGQLFALLGPSIAKGAFSAQELGWLRSVMAALPALQFGTGERLAAAADGWSVCFPDREFNFRMVSFDLNYFKYCYLKESGVDFDEIALQDDLDRLTADSLKPFGQTFMYRDFQARNIMIRDGKPWFIDFQGGRRGPVQYDLASFLFNAGTHFPEALRHELEDVYIDALGEFCKVDRDEFMEQYRLITLVRLLQEFGAYGFRGLIERKQLFIDCIAPAQKVLGELVAEPFERYPYLTEILRKVAADEGGILRNIA